MSLAVPAEISMNREMDGNALKLAPYQIVQATVSEGGLERVILNIKDRRLSAETRVPLKSGQKLNLQVLITRPNIYLRIMEEAELRHLFRLLHSFGRNARLLPLLEQMPPDSRNSAQGAVTLLGSDPAFLSGKDLSGLWQSLGLNMEALLSEGQTDKAAEGLKAFLLSHAERAGNATLSEARAEEARNALEHLKLYQLCRYRLAQENVIFLPLPFEFLAQGYLLAEKEQHEGRADDHEGGQSRGRTWKMSLNLFLSGLGNMQILMLFEGTDLRLRILCESEQKAEAVSKAIPLLEERLTTVLLRSFSVATGAGDPVLNLLKRLAPGGDHFLEAEA